MVVVLVIRSVPVIAVVLRENLVYAVKSWVELLECALVTVVAQKMESVFVVLSVAISK
jgi:hypothetical protein